MALPIMKAAVLLILVAAAHVAFLFGAYGTGLFGVARYLPYMAVVVIWLGASSLVAGVAYFRLGCTLPWLSPHIRSIPFAFLLVLISLYVGVFLAFNTFGT